jgi:hypothetical protein
MGNSTNNSDTNKGTRIFWIFLHGVGVYIANFLPFSRVMLFPVFGQVLGIVLILAPVYFYRQYLVTIPAETLQGNILNLLSGLMLMIIPGFLVFIKAFWDYMVVMVSLNTMTADIVEKGDFGDFKAHNKAVNQRKKDYMVLLLLLTGVWTVLLLAIPFVFLSLGSTLGSNKALFVLSFLASVISLFVISVLLSVAFQVFAFEELTRVETLKRSYSLVQKNFWRVVLLGIMVNIITGGILPAFVQSIAQMRPIMDILIIPFKAYHAILAENPVAMQVPINLPPFLSDVPKKIALTAVGTIVTSFVLPLGSACFTLLYMDLKKRKDG